MTRLQALPIVAALLLPSNKKTRAKDIEIKAVNTAG